MGWKEKFFISECVLIFGYSFESCTCGLDCEQKHVVLGLRFLNFGSYSRPRYFKEVEQWVEKQNSSFQNMKSYLDTHLGVVHVVLIASKDV